MVSYRFHLLATCMAAAAILSQSSSRGFLRQPEDAIMDPPDSDAEVGNADSDRKQASDEDNDDSEDVTPPRSHMQVQSKDEEFVDAPLKAASVAQADDQEQEVIMENKQGQSAASDDDKDDQSTDSDQKSFSEGDSNDAKADSQGEYVDAPMNSKSPVNDGDQEVVMESHHSAAAPAEDDDVTEHSSFHGDSQEESQDESQDDSAPADPSESLLQKVQKAAAKHEAAQTHRRAKRGVEAA